MISTLNVSPSGFDICPKDTMSEFVNALNAAKTESPEMTQCTSGDLVLHVADIILFQLLLYGIFKYLRRRDGRHENTVVADNELLLALHYLFSKTTYRRLSCFAHALISLV